MEDKPVATYFSDNALQWSRHYQGGSLALRWFNRVFRRGLRQRWDATMRRAFPVEGKTFLDVGCGTGIYGLTLARAGAKHVTGIDFAPGMIELARHLAAQEGLSDRCTFLLGDFMTLPLGEKSDLVIAMGVFDYLREPRDFWEKMIAQSRGLVIGSFPGHGWLREPIRKLRYRRKGLPVYFYHQLEVEALGQVPGLKRYEIDVFGAGYVLAGYLA